MSGELAFAHRSKLGTRCPTSANGTIANRAQPASVLPMPFVCSSLSKSRNTWSAGPSVSKAGKATSNGFEANSCRRPLIACLQRHAVNMGSPIDSEHPSGRLIADWYRMTDTCLLCAARHRLHDTIPFATAIVVLYTALRAYGVSENGTTLYCGSPGQPCISASGGCKQWQTPSAIHRSTGCWVQVL